MKINMSPPQAANQPAASPAPAQQLTDLTQIYMTLQQTHRNVYLQQIEDQIFMYRPLGRLEYKQLLNNEEFNNLQKEEIICQACTLWPEDFDFENCESAGTPTVLSREILKNSYLDSIETRVMVTRHYRQEMFDMDNQITCIINEAFPNFDIEEIEQWDIAKTAKYLSRAEWKLQNLRGLPMAYDPFILPEEAEAMNQQQPQPQAQQQRPAPQPPGVRTEEVQTPLQQGKIETVEERQARLAREGMPQKERMTPQKLAELKAKYPEMKWGDNVLDDMSVDKLSETVDTKSVALRPGL